MSDQISKDLVAAVAQLLYPSETDAPLLPFKWKRGKQSAVAAVQSRVHEKGPVETVGFDDFFEPLLRSSQGAQFAVLKQWLQERLQDPMVVRIGSSRIAIYVIGRQGHFWTGVRTVSVET